MSRYRIAAILLTFSASTALHAQVTVAEIAAVKTKLNLALPFFERVWSGVFKGRGRNLVSPKVYAYSGVTENACGKVEPGNASYCRKDNTIYLDAAFLAELAKATAAELKTDGDYAAIVVAAHEFGHLLQNQLGTVGKNSFSEEQAADCFAGAVTREAKTGGYMEAGDFEEGHFSLGIAGDRAGNGYLEQMLSRYRPGSHGNADDRHLAFNRGYYVGAQSCSAALGVAGIPPAGAGGKVLFQDSFAHVRPHKTATCTVSAVDGELTVTNAATGAEAVCGWRPAKQTVLLPDNFRLEVTMRQLKGNQYRGVGLFYGSPSAIESIIAGVVRAEGSWVMYRVSPSSGLIDFLAESLTDAQSSMIAKGYNATNRLTLDVHRQKWGAAVFLYVNGRYAGANQGRSGAVSGIRQHDESAGLFVQNPGMAAAFRAFQILALPD